MRSAICLVFAAFLGSCQQPSKTPQPVDLQGAPSGAASNVPAPSPLLHDTERFDEGSVPIYKSRIIRLPDSEQDAAKAILGGKNFCAATPEILSELLGGREPDTQRMLDTQASAARQYAKWRRDSAANPFFGDARVWMRAEADAHEALARYTDKLSPNLHAYLIESKVYSEYTGGYYVTLKGDELDVQHGSLGGPPSPWPIFILVFVEREVKRVTVGAGTAE